MTTIHCTNCNWEGLQSDLEQGPAFKLQDDGVLTTQEMVYCPECGEVELLTDDEIDELMVLLGQALPVLKDM